MTSTTPTPTFRRVDAEEIAGLAEPAVDSIVWATASTVGPDGRPRSRVVHPVLRWSPAPHGWITSRPTPLKRRHLAAHPYVTLSYWSPSHDCVYVDCAASWADDEAARRAWDEIASTAPPVGFDPATIWPEGSGAADFAVIELRASRVRVVLAASMAAGEPAPLWVAEPAVG